MHFLILGTIALSLISPISYTRSMLARRSRPHRVTRLIVWLASVAGLVGLSGTTSLAAQIFAGIFFARATYLLAMSFPFGTGGHSRLDLACLTCGIAALISYVITGNGALAIALGIIADLIGYVPTFVKTYRDPKSEDPLFFALEGGAALLGVIAVGSWQVGIAFPIYFVLCSALVLALIFRPQGRTTRVVRAESQG